MQRPAPRRKLAGDETILAEPISPERHQHTVRRACDRIFGDPHLRREKPGHEIRAARISARSDHRKFTTKGGFCCNPEIKEHKREEELRIWAAH